MHNMLAVYCELAHDDWAQLIPLVQMAHNIACSNTLHETPHYLVFGRMPTLPSDVIMGMLQADKPDSALQCTHKNVENFQFACELENQNLGERADAQAASNADLRYQQFQPDDLALVHQPRDARINPNNKLLSPWRDSCQVRRRLSPFVYRISKDGDSTENPVHVGRMKPRHHRNVFVDPDFSEINQMFLGTINKLPMPVFDKEASPVCIGSRTVERIVDHKRSRGRSSPLNVQFRVRFRGEDPNGDGNTVAKFRTAVKLFAHIVRAFRMSPVIRNYVQLPYPQSRKLLRPSHRYHHVWGRGMSWMPKLIMGMVGCQPPVRCLTFLVK